MRRSTQVGSGGGRCPRLGDTPDGWCCMCCACVPSHLAHVARSWHAPLLLPCPSTLPQTAHPPALPPSRRLLGLLWAAHMAAHLLQGLLPCGDCAAGWVHPVALSAPGRRGRGVWGDCRWAGWARECKGGWAEASCKGGRARGWLQVVGVPRLPTAASWRTMPSRA